MNIGEADDWEYVMLDTVGKIFWSKRKVFGDDNAKVNGDEDHEDDEENEAEQKQKDAQKYAKSNNKTSIQPEMDEKLKEIAQMLDMPPAWPPKLYIDKLDF